MAADANHRESTSTRRRLATWAVAATLAIVGVGAALWFAGPACPKRIVIATGGEDGAYYAFAHRYREILAASGIELEILPTAGSVENVTLLEDPHSDVSIALVQGGVAAGSDDETLRSLASLYLEPVWLFHREDIVVDDLGDLRGLRLAIGPVGSGVRSVALQLLAQNNVEPADGESTNCSTLGGDQAASALLAGKVDAAMFITSPQTPLIEKLLRAPGVRLMSVRRAKALQKRLPFLSGVTLSEGLVDLERNIPDRDVTLLAPAACLVARSDLHPALVPLLMKAAAEVHEGPTLLSRAGAFPSQQFIDYPLSDDARAWFKSGPTLLFRYLPFPAAAWLSRTKLILLPLCTLLLPLLRVAPPLYRWRIRSKIYRWYADLRAIDQKLMQDTGNEDFAADVLHLEGVERELSEVQVPLSYMEEFYHLRLHIAFVLKAITARADARDVLFRVRHRDKRNAA